jgi:hypothetical protein
MESVYEICLKQVIVNDGLKVDSQVKLPVTFKGVVSG